MIATALIWLFLGAAVIGFASTGETDSVFEYLVCLIVWPFALVTGFCRGLRGRS